MDPLRYRREFSKSSATLICWESREFAVWLLEIVDNGVGKI